MTQAEHNVADDELVEGRFLGLTSPLGSVLCPLEAFFMPFKIMLPSLEKYPKVGIEY